MRLKFLKFKNFLRIILMLDHSTTGFTASKKWGPILKLLFKNYLRKVCIYLWILFVFILFSSLFVRKTGQKRLFSISAFRIFMVIPFSKVPFFEFYENLLSSKTTRTGNVRVHSSDKRVLNTCRSNIKQHTCFYYLRLHWTLFNR